MLVKITFGGESNPLETFIFRNQQCYVIASIQHLLNRFPQIGRTCSLRPEQQIVFSYKLLDVKKRSKKIVTVPLLELFKADSNTANSSAWTTSALYANFRKEFDELVQNGSAFRR